MKNNEFMNILLPKKCLFSFPFYPKLFGISHFLIQSIYLRQYKDLNNLQIKKKS